MNLNEFGREAFELALDQGYWSGKEPVADNLVHLMSEVVEAYEAIRKGKDFKSEYADIFIILMGLCHVHCVDIEKEALKKHEINKERGYLHGTDKESKTIS